MVVGAGLHSNQYSIIPPIPQSLSCCKSLDVLLSYYFLIFPSVCQQGLCLCITGKLRRHRRPSPTSRIVLTAGIPLMALISPKTLHLTLSSLPPPLLQGLPSDSMAPSFCQRSGRKTRLWNPLVAQSDIAGRRRTPALGTLQLPSTHILDQTP